MPKSIHFVPQCTESCQHSVKWRGKDRGNLSRDWVWEGELGAGVGSWETLEWLQFNLHLPEP